MRRIDRFGSRRGPRTPAWHRPGCRRLRWPWDSSSVRSAIAARFRPCRPSADPENANGRAVLESRTRVARVVLLDCAPSARHTRLTELRGQPELSTLQMDCWAICLRGQARALDLRVVAARV